MIVFARAVAVAVVALGTAAAAEPQIKPWTGAATPKLALPDLAGGRADLGDMRGRVVVVNFWATWCVPCKDELPSLQRLRDKFAGKPVEVITVNYGEFPQRVRPFLEKEKVALRVLLDTQKDAAHDWGVGGLPMTFIIDAKGRARYSAFGELDWGAGEPLRLVEKLLAETSRGH
ncbi:MAG TPA: TlpA disulfide reductase family protein [Usitatibacter sp.]|nr:TlpA disulfide reductase family protein [Usitatibacter sp.]